MIRPAFKLIAIALANTLMVCAVEPSRSSELLPDVDEYVADIVSDLQHVDSDRQPTLNKFADEIVSTIRRDGRSKLNFICTHNSRRSHLSQVWAQTAACYFGIDRVETYSGGTESTACNVRTIAALRRAGFSIDQMTDGTNPRYRIWFSKRHDPLRAFSKVYSDTSAGNPDRDFIAAMCCSRADRECPVVQGALARIPLHYEDPKAADNTPAEAVAYDERCRQIAVEMFYVMRLVAQQIRG